MRKVEHQLDMEDTLHALRQIVARVSDETSKRCTSRGTPENPRVKKDVRALTRLRHVKRIGVITTYVANATVHLATNCCIN